eukprot:7693883-Pyramimonas_sp.AAC.1
MLTVRPECVQAFLCVHLWQISERCVPAPPPVPSPSPPPLLLHHSIDPLVKTCEVESYIHTTLITPKTTIGWCSAPASRSALSAALRQSAHLCLPGPCSTHNTHTPHPGSHAQTMYPPHAALRDAFVGTCTTVTPAMFGLWEHTFCVSCARENEDAGNSFLHAAHSCNCGCSPIPEPDQSRNSPELR